MSRVFAALLMAVTLCWPFPAALAAASNGGADQGAPNAASVLGETSVPADVAGSAAAAGGKEAGSSGKDEKPAASVDGSSSQGNAESSSATEKPASESTGASDAASTPSKQAPAASDAKKNADEQPSGGSAAKEAAGASVLAAPAPAPAATLYVSSSGSDASGTGTSTRPYASIARAVQAAGSSVQTTIIVSDNVTAAASAQVGSKSIVVRGASSGAAAPVVASTAAISLFAVTTGSVVLENLVFDGCSTSIDHCVVNVTGTAGSAVLGSGAVIKNWFVAGASGAVRINANKASFTMKSGSSIDKCLLKSSAAQAGGSAVTVAAGRVSTSTTAPSAAYRASFVMESGASISNCNTRMATNADMSGGGAVHASDADVDIQAGASIRDCGLDYLNAAGSLFDPTGKRQGGGALFANNCRLNMAGSIDGCNVNSAENTGTGGFYAGGGALFSYSYGCTAALGIDCRTTVSGTISRCSAIAGGAVFYWSEENGHGRGDALWVGASGPLSSADQVAAKVFDSLSLSGSIETCWTTDGNTTRAATLGNGNDLNQAGIGGGAICGAYNGLVLLEAGSLISGCTSGSKGGGVSSFATAVFCLDGKPGSGGGPTVQDCSAGLAGGGIGVGGSTYIEDVAVNGCSSGVLGGGLYLGKGSATVYDCLVNSCSAESYGGAVMQHAENDLFMYGGTVQGNYARVGGGGIALLGLSGGTPTAPRGIVFNYPATLNGGYTNPAACKASVLAGKATLPTVVADNTQGAGFASNLWTSDSSPTTRIAISGNFVSGSKVGVTVANGSSSYGRAGTAFGSASQPKLNLGVFASDADATLAAGYRDSALTWTDGFTVEYNDNVPGGAALQGEPPFDGIAGIPNSYARSGGSAVLLGQNNMAVNGYVFKGWSADAFSATASYAPGASFAYDAKIDKGKKGAIVLYAVWAKAGDACQIIRDTNGDGAPDAFYRGFNTLYEAFQSVLKGDRVEMLKDAPLVDFENARGAYPANGVVALPAAATGVVLATAPAVQPVVGAKPWQGAAPSSGAPVAVIARTKGGSVDATLAVAGRLSVRGVVFDGGCTPGQWRNGGGLQASVAFLSVSGAGSSLSLGSGATVQNACAVTSSGAGVFAGAGGTFYLMKGSAVLNCTALDGGGVGASSSSASSPAVLRLEGGSIEGCRAVRMGGGVYVGSNASAALSASAFVRSNVAGRSGGGAYVESTGKLTVSDAAVSENACLADSVDAGRRSAHVGGIGTGAFSGESPLVVLSGNAVVSGNYGRGADEGSGADASSSDLEAAGSSGRYSVTVEAAGLGSSARVGITSADDSLLARGAVFAQVKCGQASAAANLGAFFNNKMPGFFGAAGLGSSVVWRAPTVGVSFTKVGANQTTGLYAPLPGATFNVYRYVGCVEVCASSINDGRIDRASLTSKQWAPLIGAAGEEGAPGNAANVPFAFSSASGSSAGIVSLTGLMPGSWYMLVETSAPRGFQKPVGQWALKVVEQPAGSGSYVIDATTMLARKGSDGSLPPAFTTAVQTASGQQRGLFLPNIPVFDLPFAGSGLLMPALVGIGAVLAASGLALRRRKPAKP